MRKPLTALAALAAVAVLPPGSAQAASRYCSPSGDYCTAVERRDGRVILRVDTFSFREYTLCVTPPRGRGTCRGFRLRRDSGGLYRSAVRWDRYFPNRGAGAYAVRWKVGGGRIGPVLSFRRSAASRSG